jgi:hypothetical protein
VLIPVAWCAALLAQAQMVFELAAVAGRSPSDELRAADLLVLQGAYASSAEARAALTRVTTELPEARLPRGSRIALIRRMAYILGLIGAGERPSVLRSILGWIFVGIVFVVGFVLPFVWIPYMAVWMRKSTLALGARATTFYASEAAVDAGVTVRQAQTVRAGLAGGFLRMTLLLSVPIALAVLALVRGGWVAAGVIAFVVLSFVATSAWIGYRWLRRRRAAAWRRHAASAPPRERDARRPQ